MALVLAAGCGLAGCEGAPVEQVEGARREVDAARQAEADKYAAEEFAQLEDSLRAGLIELDRQQAQFGILRDYEAARHALGWTAARAGQVRQQAQENKESLGQVAADALKMASTDVEATASSVAKIPRRTEYLEEIHSFKSDLKALRAALQEINADLRAENFEQVQTKAKAVQGQAERLRREVRGVMAQEGLLAPRAGKRR
ncbi:MAG: hypothetical protein HYW07_10320 [Candidatus Latescibacteria bacterium]|nr:hypothetical protein [Candidatus Latescibacterota bacterium]